MSAAAPRDYPVILTVDYPDRELNRLTSVFRIFVALPIMAVLGSMGGLVLENDDVGTTALGGAGLLFIPVLLLIVFRQKYPRWWFDFNRELTRFSARVMVYLALLRDEYPSTDEEQSVHLELPYPDVVRDLNRWAPLYKWFLAIPHWIVLLFLNVAAIVTIVIAWFAILFTGRYPRGLFDFVVGVLRWNNRVIAYALTLVTDEYPPFRLGP